MNYLVLIIVALAGIAFGMYLALVSKGAPPANPPEGKREMRGQGSGPPASRRFVVLSSAKRAGERHCFVMSDRKNKKWNDYIFGSTPVVRSELGNKKYPCSVIIGSGFV